MIVLCLWRLVWDLYNGMESCRRSDWNWIDSREHIQDIRDYAGFHVGSYRTAEATTAIKALEMRNRLAVCRL